MTERKIRRGDMKRIAMIAVAAALAFSALALTACGESEEPVTRYEITAAFICNSTIG